MSAALGAATRRRQADLGSIAVCTAARLCVWRYAGHRENQKHPTMSLVTLPGCPLTSYDSPIYLCTNPNTIVPLNVSYFDVPASLMWYHLTLGDLIR